MNSLDERIKGIRGILFDKDGTLIDFKSLWIPLAFELISKLTGETGLTQGQKAVLLDRIGLREDGGLLPEGIYTAGTLEDVAQVLYGHMGELGLGFTDFETFAGTLKSETNAYMAANRNGIRTIGNVGDTLAAFREKGMTLGVSTSDFKESTVLCLEETGLMKYFHYIGCPGNGKRPKPSGDILFDFCDRFGLEPEEIAVVGDTSTDIAFASGNSAGLSVGVLSGAGDRGSLSAADVLLGDVNELAGLFGCDKATASI